MIIFESYTEWRGTEYVTTTKVYDTAKLVPGWVGCHWDNPAIIASEAVEGTNMSDDMLKIINDLGAVEIEEDDNEYFPSPSQSNEVEGTRNKDELLRIVEEIIKECKENFPKHCDNCRYSYNDDGWCCFKDRPTTWGVETSDKGTQPDSSSSEAVEDDWSIEELLEKGYC